MVNVVLWPASWLNKRGVALPATRYKAIVLDVILGIKQHGQTETVKYWPGYLMHCLQKHFQIHGDEYYQEAKDFRTPLAAVLTNTEALPVIDHTRALAEACRDLLKTTRKTRQKSPADSQLPLL